MYKTMRDGEGTMLVIPSYGTKVCPRCGAGMFGDMNVCYDCLYRFGDDEEEAVPHMPCDWDDGPVPEEAYEGLAIEEAESSVAPLHLHVSTAALDVSVPLPPQGLLVGRGSSCDIRLHANAVSRRHVRIEPEGEGAIVTDQGATNLAKLHDKTISGSAHMSIGDELKVCGATMRLCQ